MIRLKDLLKEETFTAISKDSGKVSVFKSKASRDAAIKSGTHTQSKKTSEPVSKSQPKVSTPSTGVAAAAKARATGEQPNHTSTSHPASNPMVNKSTKDMAEKAGITPRVVGRQEYRKKMLQATLSALTDSNFHSEAKELLNKLTIDGTDPAEYENADDDARELGVGVSKSAGWDGEEAANGIAYTLRMNGLHKEADTILSVFK